MKKIKGILLAVCCCTLVLSDVQTTRAFGAEPTVVYDGETHEFSFENVKNEDLFTDLKNVMPGDRIVQKICLKVKNCYNAIFIELHAEALDKSPVFKEIALNVYQGKERLEMGLEYPIGDLAEGVSLDDGFLQDETMELYVEIEVPKDMGNEIANLREEIQWVFTAYERDGSSDPVIIQSANVPKTGDKNLAIGYFAAAGCAAIGIALPFVMRKKKRT